MSKTKETDQLLHAARAREITNLQRFVDKVVIVTGAGSGIGEATARRFSQEGACVVLADRVQARIERVAAELPTERTLVHKCDVAKHAEIGALVRATIRKFGKLDVLVNNAGVAATGDVTQATLRDWETVMAINVGGAFHGCRAAMPDPQQRLHRQYSVSLRTWRGLGHVRLRHFEGRGRQSHAVARA